MRFIRSIVAFSLKNRFFTYFWAALLAIAGIISFRQMPIEAFPDVTNTQIVIVSQWPGRSAQEVERFVTVPIEVNLNSVQRKANLRSMSMFGLSVITVIFEDGVEDFFARQQVTNLMGGLDLPEGVAPAVQPPYGPTGEIFRYVLHSRTKDSRELLTIQNWVIDRQLRQVPGVADVVDFGGREKIYEIQVDPGRLMQYDLTPLEVYQAVARSNINVGGDVIERNGQAFVVRGLGLLDNLDDIGNIIIQARQSVPVLVKNVARVVESDLPRVGQVGLDANDDVVEGIIVMRKGANPAEVLASVKEKIADLNDRILPADVHMATIYDRDDLMHFTTRTVMHNLIEGIVLVTAIVLLFMAEWRTTLIVSIIIPLSLLFAFLCLQMKGLSANLLSLGAIDFGIIVDGAVVMVEGIFVAMDRLARRVGMDKFNRMGKLGLIKQTGTRMGKAVFFSKLIIITALVPIFSFQKVEGKMFSPLAWTLGFALMGALIFSLTLVPVLCADLLRRNVREKHGIVAAFFDKWAFRGFLRAYKRPRTAFAAAAGALVLSLGSLHWMGTEFLPELNEGALWVEAKMPMSMSLSETVKMVRTLREKINALPEVTGVLSQTGRSNDGTDPSGFYYVQMQVNLKPLKEWRKGVRTSELIDEMDRELKQFQGINFNYSQPIIDNVAEAVAGMNANNAVKIFGPDLAVLDTLADQVFPQIERVQGIKDPGVLRNLGQPEIQVRLSDTRMALYGVSTADAQAVIEMAIGGKTANVMFEEDRRFDIRLRFPQEYRNGVEEIKAILVPTLAGGHIALNEIATVGTTTGPAFIYRDNNSRFIGVKFTVRGRDLGSTIAEARRNVEANVKLPRGYRIEWTGEFENQVRATKRLGQVVPISLAAIFIILFIALGDARNAGLVLINVPFALIGGILALHLTGINFGISAGVGFIALFGICVQNGVILVEEFNRNLDQKLGLDRSITDGVRVRIRPVVMTALMASLGLLPAAISTGIGSEAQKPLAVVIIGGLVTATLFILFVFPITFRFFRGRTLRKKLDPAAV
ncbi:MAG: efflux RND transporter permease subunit [Flavobacteriales bacterium]|nr:efflux RND transporter permease subunit [Flavobacteriales bacterium]MEB2342068.1 CusA/CzcA family heavy metal efflux RND transporter [Flavobacteriia bacterium]